ncbi:MAG: SRPBCC family protein [Nostocoides sp.]
MTQHEFEPRVTSASREVAAPAAVIFELIADPSQQPRWDGNANLVVAAPGQRVHAVGDVFVMTIHLGQDRENHIVEFEEGRLIAWRPSELGSPPPGHLWRWELQPIDETTTRVTHTYDWSELSDPNRLARARATTAQRLLASIDGLARLAEGP